MLYLSLFAKLPDSGSTEINKPLRCERMMMGGLKCCRERLKFDTEQSGMLWAKCSICGLWSQKHPGSPVAYKGYAKQDWRCLVCGSSVQAKTVYHSIYIPRSLAGFGEVETKTTPYCPECEKEPNSYGLPVYYDEDGRY